MVSRDDHTRHDVVRVHVAELIAIHNKNEQIEMLMSAKAKTLRVAGPSSRGLRCRRDRSIDA
jgi:hypothetical protein